MAQQGKSKALSDPARNKQIVKNLLHEKSPMVMGSYFGFIEEHFQGVKDCDQFDREGNVIGHMSKENIEKMKLAHKFAVKVIDKIIPNTLTIDNSNSVVGNIDPAFQKAMIHISQQARLNAEAEAGTLNEITALEIRTISRSDER